MKTITPKNRGIKKRMARRLDMRRMYTIKREDFFKIPNFTQYKIIEIGFLWISLFLDEEEVQILNTQGIKTSPG